MKPRPHSRHSAFVSTAALLLALALAPGCTRDASAPAALDGRDDRAHAPKGDGRTRPHQGSHQYEAEAFGTPGATSLSPTLAVLDYLAAPDDPARFEGALGAVRRAGPDHLNAYLEAFLLAEAGRDAELAAVLKDKLGARASTWRYLFQVHRDQLPGLLEIQPAEICYLHRVELHIRRQQAGEKGFPKELRSCPVDGTPYEALPEGQSLGASDHRCRRCDAVRASAEAHRLWPVFQQVAWDSHSEDRISHWVDRHDAILTAERVFEDLGFTAGMNIADIGAGEGWFTLPFARALGPDGHIWAEDIFPGFLDFIAWRAQDEGLDNVSTVLGQPADVSLPGDTMDRIFVCEVYKYISTNAQKDDPAVFERQVRPFVASLRRALRDDGRLVFIEHDDPVEDPKAIAPATIIEQLERLGFRLVEQSGIYAPRQRVLVFEKAPLPG
jgi:ubiquinone/menaquinone biosynthesis C-methylase UbiE